MHCCTSGCPGNQPGGYNLPTGTSTLSLYLVVCDHSRARISPRPRVSTDTGCAGCRRVGKRLNVENIHTSPPPDTVPVVVLREMIFWVLHSGSRVAFQRSAKYLLTRVCTCVCPGFYSGLAVFYPPAERGKTYQRSPIYYTWCHITDEYNPYILQPYSTSIPYPSKYDIPRTGIVLYH